MNLPRHNRLKNEKIFKEVLNSGRKFVSDYFIMLSKKYKDQPFPMIGIVVSKKVGSAVERNAAKRKIREAAHLLLDKFASSSSTVFILRRNLVEADIEKVKASLEKGLGSF